jgi:PST family polysaccharide transporter
LWPWSSPLAKTLLKESWPLILSGLAVIVYVKIDQIMLGQMLGDKAVGLYSAATRISEVWYFIPTTIVASVAPAIYAAKKEASEATYYRQIEKLFRLLSLSSITIAVPMSFLSTTIITMLFGNSYAPAGPILAIHIWSALFIFIGVAASPWFIAEGLTQLSFQKNLFGAMTNVLLNLILIPIYDGVGASIATVISYGVSILANALDDRTRKIFNLQMKSLVFFWRL